MANPVVKRLKNMVEELASTVPVLQNMRNQALKERHWKKIEIVISRRVYIHMTFVISFSLNTIHNQPNACKCCTWYMFFVKFIKKI
jgi:hypothetical protein